MHLICTKRIELRGRFGEGKKIVIPNKRILRGSLNIGTAYKKRKVCAFRVNGNFFPGTRATINWERGKQQNRKRAQKGA